MEETSAAAQALSGQAHELNELVGFFRTGEVVTANSNVVTKPAAAKPVAKPAAPKPVARKLPPVAGNTALKADDDTWEEF